MSSTPTSVLPCSRTADTRSRTTMEAGDDDIDRGRDRARVTHRCRRHRNQLPRGRLRRTGHHAARLRPPRLRAYEQSNDAMRDLLRNYFAVDPAMITDELVEIRYQASIADGAYEAYRTMFFDPRHAGSELGITENEVRAIATPTLLVHGREDKAVPLQVSVTMLGLLP